MAKTVVAIKVGGTLRRRMFFEIKGRTVHHAAQGTEATPDEGRVRRRMRANRQVESPLNEVDHREARAEVYGRLRIPGHKVDYDRRDEPRYVFVAIDSKLAARRSLLRSAGFVILRQAQGSCAGMGVR